MAFNIEPNTAYTLPEIEQGLKVAKVQTLRKWVADGRLPAKKMGRTWIVLGSDLLRIIGSG